MRKPSWLLLIIFFNLCGFFSSAEAIETIAWKKWSRSVFELAQKEHKLVLIYGKVSWCHWCQKMDSVSFTDPAVIQLVSHSYIPVKVDIEQDVAVANRYQITEIPSLIVLDAENKELKRFYGYSSSQNLINKLSGFAQQ
ncbi:MAG TPA: DUF255 domain-containing protein [Gammaproteobacteria bacterium]|nr:DUF255 domain-containing protein [Gammaproteobacteria bacterium]